MLSLPGSPVEVQNTLVGPFSIVANLPFPDQTARSLTERSWSGMPRSLCRR